MEMETEEEIIAEFSVVGLPPTLQRALSQKAWEEIRERQRCFQEAAQKAYKRPVKAGEEVAVYVRYQRSRGDEAALDILGGVIEALHRAGVQEGGVVTELAYLEQDGEEDIYWVEIMQRHPSIEADYQPHAWVKSGPSPLTP